MRRPTRIAGREAVFEFLPEKLRAYPFIYIDIYSSMPLLLPQLLLRHRRRSIAQTRYDELDLVTSMNHRAKFLSRRLYRLTVSMPTQSTHRHTHTAEQTDSSTWTTKWSVKLANRTKLAQQSCDV